MQNKSRRQSGLRSRIRLFALVPLLSLLGAARPALAQHDSALAFSPNYDSARGGASNDFDGTHTLAALGITDPSPGGPHATITGGTLQIARLNNEWTTTPILKAGTGVPFGYSYIEFTGDSVGAQSSQLHVLGRYDPNGGGPGISRSYCACVMSSRVFVGLTYNMEAANSGQPEFAFGGSANYTFKPEDKYRLALFLEPGVEQSTDVRAELTNLTTGEVSVARHDNDRSIPIAAGLWGIGAFWCAPAKISRWAINFNFGDSMSSSYPITRTKCLVCRGDSITYGNGASSFGTTQGTNYPSVALRLLGGNWDGFIPALPGVGTEGFNSQNGTDLAKIPVGYTTSVFSYLGGCNDLDYFVRTTVAGKPDTNSAPAAIFARIKSQLQEARAAGYVNVVCGTVLYSQQVAGSGKTQAQNTALYHTACDQLNALIRTGLTGAANGKVADAIADYNALPQLKDTPGNPNFAGDGRHPNDAGYALMGPVLYKAIASIPGLGMTASSKAKTASARSPAQQ